jgi:hypothetical protein
MKRILATIFILLFAFQMSFGQKTYTVIDQKPIQSYDIYMNKQKTNNKVAWACLGSGIAMTITGIGINVGGGIIDGDPTNNTKGLWLSYLGGATTLTSIPFFISAGKNKRKARMSLKNESVTISKTTISNLNYTSVSLVIPF